MGTPTMSFDQENQEVLPPSGPISQDLEVRVFGSLVTAQRVAVPRNEKKILALLREYAATGGDKYYYSWEAKQKRGGKGLIEGPTIKATMLVARLYGNCAIDVRSMPFDATHDITYARFADLETGFSLTRAFKQRKSQDIGMSDKERAEDIVFQIGQSKAIRNVVNNALEHFTMELVDQAKSALIDWLTNNKENVDKAWKKIDALCEQYNVTLKMLEDMIGRPNGEWLPRHLAKALITMRSIENGDATVQDIFGSPNIPTTEPKTEPPKQEGGKEGDAPHAKAGRATAGTRKPRQSAQAADSGAQASSPETPKEEAKPAAPQQSASAESKAAASQPAEQTAAPDGGDTSIAQGAAASNPAAPAQQQVQQPPAPPVDDEDQSWWSSGE